jgi:hypothetical protein
MSALLLFFLRRLVFKDLQPGQCFQNLPLPFQLGVGRDLLSSVFLNHTHILLTIPILSKMKSFLMHLLKDQPSSFISLFL